MSACSCRKFDFFPKGTAGADGWMSLYFKYADQFSDNQQIGFGFKLHVINFQFPSQTLTKGMACFADTMPLHCCARFNIVLSWSSLHIMCMCLDGHAQSFSSSSVLLCLHCNQCVMYQWSSFEQFGVSTRNDVIRRSGKTKLTYAVLCSV